MQRITVQPETLLVRPFIVAAVLRGVRFDERRYNSFIDLQDKLHTTLCRQRSLVAIGTHDLDTLQGPFTYEAQPPECIQFVPLKQTRSFDAASLMQHYLVNDLKLRKYVPIIHNSVVYPVIYDSQKTVLSLPPIINGQHSAVCWNLFLCWWCFSVICLCGGLFCVWACLVCAHAHMTDTMYAHHCVYRIDTHRHTHAYVST